MSEMDKLQADAVNRARDMYRRSQNYNVNSLPNGYNGSMRDQAQKNNSSQNPIQQQSQQKTQRQPMKTTANESAEEVVKEVAEDKIIENATQERKEETQNIQQGFHGGDFLDMLLSDKERTLIILLIALLNEEGANTSLLLALMYLIM